MKKIGLLNIQHIDNYGANLIAYAMEHEISEIVGKDAVIETIDYNVNQHLAWKQASSIKNTYLQFGFRGVKNKILKILHRYFSVSGIKLVVNNFPLFKMYKSIKKKVYGGSYNYNNDEQIRLKNFESFRRQFLNRTNKYSYENFNEISYDIVVVGSDVIWKPQRLLSKEERRAFFLVDICDKTRKIAYAASIGVSDADELKRLTSRYIKYIKPFDFISMRESSATKYIQSLFPNRKIYNCIDPVFLRKGEEYKQLVKISNNEKFIYAYILGKNRKAINFVKDFAKKENLKVRYHTINKSDFEDGECTVTDGPCEFLSNIYNAEYIVTDSFHGTAFSIIFKKRFLSFTRGKLSVRLENFLHSIHLESRLIDENVTFEMLTENIDYAEVEKYLIPWIDSSHKFLIEGICS